MGVLSVAPDVPDARYRIRGANPNTHLYFEWQTDNSVLAVRLNPDSKAQQWKISALQQTGNYTLTNVAGNANLSILEHTQDGQTKYRLNTGGSQVWNLDARHDQFVIGVAENDNCVGLSENNVLIISPRRNGQNQRFVLEPVEPVDITPGNWFIKNRATNGQLSIWFGSDAYTTPIRVSPAKTSAAGVSRTWTVVAKGGGYTLANTQSAGEVQQITPGIPRWITQSDGAVITLVENVCQLVPVPGTEFYYITVSTEANSRVLMDTNPTGAKGGLVSTGAMEQDDTRQHWQFYVPVPVQST